MPIYEFKCRYCNDDFEILVLNAQSDEQITCPLCHGSDLERVLSVCAKGNSQSQGIDSSCRSRSTGFS